PARDAGGAHPRPAAGGGRAGPPRDRLRRPLRPRSPLPPDALDRLTRARVRRRILYAMLFVAWTAEPPIDRDTVLFCARWRSPFAALGPLFVSWPGIRLFPWQLLLLALVPVCLLSAAAFRRRSTVMDAAILVSAASLALTFAWGWSRGASLYDGYYQVWRFLA